MSRPERINKCRYLIIVQSKPENGSWADVEEFPPIFQGEANILLNRLRVRLPALKHRKIERRVPDLRHPSNQQR